MYIPPSFLETDSTRLHDFMEQHSFATLTSSHEGEPFASHLPLLLDRDVGPHGRLIGHMARPNPHWQLAVDQRVLVIYHGPHAYVSPGWIEAQNVVPTWNYVAIHAYGTLRLIDDRDRLYDILQRTVSRYESNREQPWSMDSPNADFIEKLLAAIMGFEIDVDRLEGKWKLNQNHSPERREQIIRGLLETDRHDERRIANLMDATR
ncbi:MAG: FMN-binding negative transcriptional regulator [Planctomycetota bacterium]|nr:FMN-binding negative transcriptional regulator [Planctomycetota bacterium]